VIDDAAQIPCSPEDIQSSSGEEDVPLSSQRNHARMTGPVNKYSYGTAIIRSPTKKQRQVISSPASTPGIQSKAQFLTDMANTIVTFGDECANGDHDVNVSIIP
jgi:hypothetical protein